jgi:hypothetical protein
MRLTPLVLLALVGCPSNPAPVGGISSAVVTVSSAAPSAPVVDAPSALPSVSASAAPAGPKWLEAAARAPAQYANAAKREYENGSPLRHDQQINALLDLVAAQDPSSTGLRAAAKLLDDGKGAGADMNWTGSGNSPAGGLLHAAGIAILEDLVTRACAANPKDTAMGRAIETIPLPATYGSALDTAAMGDDREALRVAAAACGVKPKAPKAFRRE